MIVRKGAARAGFLPNVGPILGPVPLGIDGGIGGEHGSVKLRVGEPKPRRPFVVEIRERALFELGRLEALEKIMNTTTAHSLTIAHDRLREQFLDTFHQAVCPRGLFRHPNRRHL